jgi:protein-disulfide isomerase
VDGFGLVLVVCAVIVAALTANRVFGWKLLQRLAPAPSSTERVRNWESLLDNRPSLGQADAAVRIIVIGNYDCYACAEYEATLGVVRTRYPRDVSVRYVNLASPSHTFATPSAQVALCAHEQGAFEAAHHLLFAQQDSFGVKAWVDYARKVHIGDIGSFEECLRHDRALQRLARDEEIARAVRPRRLPVVIIEGEKWRRLPTAAQLDSLVASAALAREQRKAGK